jgi:hypothetical protein
MPVCTAVYPWPFWLKAFWLKSLLMLESCRLLARPVHACGAMAADVKLPLAALGLSMLPQLEASHFTILRMVSAFWQLACQPLLVPATPRSCTTKESVTDCTTSTLTISLHEALFPGEIGVAVQPTVKTFEKPHEETFEKPYEKPDESSYEDSWPALGGALPCPQDRAAEESEAHPEEVALPPVAGSCPQCV